MEQIYFLIAAVALYFGADWALKFYESYIGRRVGNRSIVFFFILLFMAMISFSAIQYFGDGKATAPEKPPIAIEKSR